MSLTGISIHDVHHQRTIATTEVSYHPAVAEVLQTEQVAMSAAKIQTPASYIMHAVPRPTST